MPDRDAEMMAAADALKKLVGDFCLERQVKNDGLLGIARNLPAIRDAVLDALRTARSAEAEAMREAVVADLSAHIAAYEREIAVSRHDRHKERLEERVLTLDAARSRVRALPLGGSAWRPRFRHRKRGTEYEVLGVGKMQAENWKELTPVEDMMIPASVDMREVTIYRNLADGSLWVRPREEFEDGRFEPLPTPPEAKGEQS